MYILLIKLNNSAVVSDGILVVSKLRKAIRTIIKGLQVVWRTILQLIGVVIDSKFEPLHLSVN